MPRRLTRPRIETAQRNATLRDVRDLCEIYGIRDEDLRRQLMDLARGGRERGWWQGVGLAPALESLIGMEGSAVAIHESQLVGVPGLLQTRDYAAAMLEIFGPADAEARKAAVDIRMRRHEILDADVPPTLHVVIDEAVLCRIVGGPAVMRDQLLHLARLAGNGIIDFRVLPFGAGAHPGMISGFTVEVDWRTSKSCTNGSCVQVAAIDDLVGIRDSKDPQSGVLMYTRSEWQDFLAGAKNGDFDDLVK